MFYSLALNSDYLAPMVDKFIAISPCAYTGINPVKSYDGFFSSLADYNISAIYGPDWTSKYNQMCLTYKEPCSSLGQLASG